MVWRGLSLCALLLLVAEWVSWLMVMLDVFSICNMMVEDYVELIVYEVKVRRVDLFSDLCNLVKCEVYRALFS